MPGGHVKLTLKSIQNVDVLGELLRDLFFDQRHGIGCYETFILRDEVNPLESVRVEYDTCFNWKRACLAVDNNYVEMWHYWDGDGTLAFILADSVLLNTDCKCNYDWKKISHKEWQYYRSG